MVTSKHGSLYGSVTATIRPPRRSVLVLSIALTTRLSWTIRKYAQILISRAKVRANSDFPVIVLDDMHCGCSYAPHNSGNASH